MQSRARYLTPSNTRKMEAYNNLNVTKFAFQGQPFITFSHKCGKVAINGVGVKMMELKYGDMVEFYRKEIDGRSEWYLAPVKVNGFKLTRHTASRTLIFTRKELVVAIYNSIFYEGDTGRAYILRKRKVDGKDVYKLDFSKLKNTHK